MDAKPGSPAPMQPWSVRGPSSAFGGLPVPSCERNQSPAPTDQEIETSLPAGALFYWQSLRDAATITAPRFPPLQAHTSLVRGFR